MLQLLPDASRNLADSPEAHTSFPRVKKASAAASQNALPAHVLTYHRFDAASPVLGVPRDLAGDAALGGSGQW
jgi:hypothetical protein